jgi:hypothetical protein
MVSDTTAELLQKCLAAARAGADFPKVWSSILKNHPLVLGAPIQGLDGGRPVLEVRLITGQRLILDAEGYALA